MLPSYWCHARCSVGIGPGTATVTGSVNGFDGDPVRKHLQRKERLTTLLELRRLYRDILHASSVLEIPSPVYEAGQQPPPSPPPQQQQPEGRDAESTASSHSVDSAMAAEEGEEEREMAEQEKKQKALAVIADMQLTSDQLKVRSERGICLSSYVRPA